jgi:hypothetical protein
MRHEGCRRHHVKKWDKMEDLEQSLGAVSPACGGHSEVHNPDRFTGEYEAEERLDVVTSWR